MPNRRSYQDQRLEQKHRVLDAEISRLDRQAHLTPQEQRAVAELKKEKLRTKDLLANIRRG
jgi:uncharacterized protein YdcH (DUF465 family)